jgi:type IV pilus assembly protein PilQ
MLLCIIGALGFMVSGCAEKKSAPDPFFTEWKVRAEESQPVQPVKQARSVDLPGEEPQAGPDELIAAEERWPVDVGRSDRPLPDSKVTLSMRNTDVNVILRALARIVNQNIMMNDSVRGITDINVINTPWDQVFIALLRTRGLTYRWEDDIIRVMTMDDMQHDRTLSEIFLKEKQQKQAQLQVEPLITRLVPVDYTDANTLSLHLEKLLTKKKTERGEVPRGSVSVDVNSNSLIIHAIKGDIERMIPIINEIDQPTQQVLIEAHIVEATKEAARELGIQWGGISHSSSGDRNYWVTPGANAGNTTGVSLDTPLSPTSGTAVDFPADFTKNLHGNGGFTLGFLSQDLNNYILNVQLSAMETESKLNILSHPSITTLDNQMAVIESGARIPYQSIDKNGQVETEFENATLRLEVTPHIIDEDVVKLQIVTNKDEVDFSRQVLGTPTIITKRAETTLLLEDGETTVIGGLSKGVSSGSGSGAPGLQDIPGLGYLFKGRGVAEKMEEVLIFITPHILKPRKVQHSAQSVAEEQ